MLPRIQLGLQPAAAHTRAGHGCRYGWGCPNTGRRPYIEAQSDATSREYADGCNAAHIHSRVESNAISGARPVSYTRANSYVDSPSVPDTGTNGCAESHGHANPYGHTDSDTDTGGYSATNSHADGYSGSDCTTNSNADTGPNAYTHSYPA